MRKGIVLLSGGLDSLVSLDIAKKDLDIEMALFFDYGQRAFIEERQSASDIAKYYNIELKTIELPFLKELAKCPLVGIGDDLSELDSVWIPNRNGLFLNIAACYCDKLKYDFIIFGANKEEGRDFPDNSVEFAKICDKFFSYSTLNKPKVLAPCLQFDKIQIINYAIDNNVPLNLLKSCYDSSKNTGKKHCGKCMSCKLLFQAIKKSKKPELIKELF